MVQNKQRKLTLWAVIALGNSLVSALLIVVLRSIVLRDPPGSEFGPGFISLTARAVKGYNPHMLYRIMHNLTTKWVVGFYLVTIALGIFLIARTKWKSQSILYAYIAISIISSLFLILFCASLFLPIGDLVTPIG